MVIIKKLTSHSKLQSTLWVYRVYLEKTCHNRNHYTCLSVTPQTKQISSATTLVYWKKWTTQLVAWFILISIFLMLYLYLSEKQNNRITKKTKQRHVKGVYQDYSISCYTTFKMSRARLRLLTTGSGASSSLHITQGTPVPISTAIFAAQFT